MPFYVIKKTTGEIVAKCHYRPDLLDLASRGEFVIESNEDIRINQYVYKDGKFVKSEKFYKEREEQLKREAEITKKERWLHRRLVELLEAAEKEGLVKIKGTDREILNWQKEAKPEL